MDGNGSKEVEAKVGKCPFLKEDCIGKRCALYIEMKKVIGGGLQQTFGLCSFNATVQVLSSINLKAPASQQMIQVPKLMRG